MYIIFIMYIIYIYIYYTYFDWSCPLYFKVSHWPLPSFGGWTNNAWPFGSSQKPRSWRRRSEVPPWSFMAYKTHWSLRLLGQNWCCGFLGQNFEYVETKTIGLCYLYENVSTQRNALLQMGYVISWYDLQYEIIWYVCTIHISLFYKWYGTFDAD